MRVFADLGLVTLDTSFDPKGFKQHVEQALVDAFGRSKVERHAKCIEVEAGATTLPADVVGMPRAGSANLCACRGGRSRTGHA